MHIIQKSLILIVALLILSPQSSAENKSSAKNVPSKLSKSKPRLTGSHGEDMLLSTKSPNPDFMKNTRGRSIASDRANPVRLSKMCRDSYGVVHYADGQMGEKEYQECLSQQSSGSLDQQYFGSGQRQAGAGILFIQ